MNPKSKGRKKTRGRVKASAQNQGSAEEPRHDPLIAAIGASEAGRAVIQRGSEVSKARVSKLQQELAATKEYLQSMIETQEATNDELQSANEELEAAKEELQSANEELTTVTGELRNRNLEITRLNNDLTNLFASVDAAVVLIGGDLTIRRFSPTAEKFLGLTPADVGRPLLNINPTVEIPDFPSVVGQVIANSRPVERELKAAQGGRFLLRILPYRVFENKIDGAVINIISAQPNTPRGSEP